MDTAMSSIEKDERFDVSAADFTRRARQAGWPFWRGVMIGFMSAFPIAYVAFGDSFASLG